ncbi:MAG: glutamyl-tRNA reductase [Bacteroidota bacterium]
MTLFSLGLNHVKASTAVREAFVLDEGACRTLYERLSLSPAGEVIVVSTCNRTEAVVYGTAADRDAVIAALSAHAQAAWPEAEAFEFQDEAAVRHVLGLASGLRSQVLGDAQILHQVKVAYHEAVEANRVNAVLHRLMHAAFHVAKQVRTETGLTQGAASVSSLAVAAARAQAPGGSLDGQRVLLIGAGEMGLAALNALTTFDLARLDIANRSPERAAAAAAKYGGLVLDWQARHAAMQDADVVLVASGADQPVVQAEALAPRDPLSPALVIDIAVPRNVERAVDTLPGYKVLDLDHLNRAVEATAEARRNALPAAEALVEQGLSEYVTWFFHQQALQPTIQAIRSTFDAIRRQEIERHAHRIPEVAREDVERLTTSIMQKLLAVPVVRLKATDPESLDFVRGVKALATIFSQSDCPVTSDLMPDPLFEAPGPQPTPPERTAAAPGAPVERAAAPPAAAPARCPFGHEASRTTLAPPTSSATPSGDANRNARQ